MSYLMVIFCRSYGTDLKAENEPNYLRSIFYEIMCIIHLYPLMSSMLVLDTGARLQVRAIFKSVAHQRIYKRHLILEICTLTARLVPYYHR